MGWRQNWRVFHSPTDLMATSTPKRWLLLSRRAACLSESLGLLALSCTDMGDQGATALAAALLESGVGCQLMLNSCVSSKPYRLGWPGSVAPGTGCEARREPWVAPLRRLGQCIRDPRSSRPSFRGRSLADCGTIGRSVGCQCTCKSAMMRYGFSIGWG
jgi:hypothetical protein